MQIILVFVELYNLINSSILAGPYLITFIQREQLALSLRCNGMNRAVLLLMWSKATLASPWSRSTPDVI